MFNSLGAVLLHVEMCLAASLAETLWYSASSGLICMIQSARCCGGGRLPFIRHSHLMGYSTHFCWVGNFVWHGKKNENPFLCYLCNTYLYSVEIERYYMKNVYLKDLNLKNYIVCTCFFLHQSRRARKQRYLAARRALPGTVPPAPSQFSHPRTPSYALSTQWRSHTPPHPSLLQTMASSPPSQEEKYPALSFLSVLISIMPPDHAVFLGLPRAMALSFRRMLGEK